MKMNMVNRKIESRKIESRKIANRKIESRKMANRTWMKLGAVSCMLALSLAGCGSAYSAQENGDTVTGADWNGSKTNGMAVGVQAAGDAYYDDFYEEYAAEDYGYDGEYLEYDMADDSGSYTGSQSSSSAMEANEGAKLIRNVDISLETEHFDDAVRLIEQKTAEAGGYIQDSQLYDYSSGMRNQVITVRVPYEKVDGFLTGLDEYATIRSKSDTTQDVTLQYADVETHIESLETQHKRLLELMEQAENIEDIIVLNREITEVESELNSYKKQIRNYDNLVSYSTITVSIKESTYIRPVEDTTLWSRMTSGFTDKMHDIGEFFSDLLVWIVVNLPIFVILAIIVVLHIVIIKLIIRGARKKRAKVIAKREAEQQAEIGEGADGKAQTEDESGEAPVQNHS